MVELIFILCCLLMLCLFKKGVVIVSFRELVFMWKMCFDECCNVDFVVS